MSYASRLGRFFGLILGLALVCQAPAYAGQNAAAVYYRAGDTNKAADTGTAELLRTMVREGKVVEDARIRELLAANQDALALFRQGAAIDECDFSFGKQEEVDSPMPISRNTFLLVNLLLYEGQMLAREGKIERALDDFVAVLRFEGHCLRQPNLLMINIGGNAVHEISHRVLRGFILSKELKAPECARLVETLTALSKEMLPLEVVLREEGQVKLRGLKRVGEETLERHLQKDKFLASYYSDVEKNAALYEAQRNELLIRYSQAYDDTEYTAWEKQMDESSSWGIPWVSEVLMIMKIPTARYTAQNYAKRVVLLDGSGRRVIKEIAAIKSRLNVMLAGAMIRYYEITQGRTPESLEMLEGKEKLRDPFNPGQSLKFSRNNNGWVVYGIGPDLKDNNGEIIFKDNVDEPGDIVF